MMTPRAAHISGALGYSRRKVVRYIVTVTLVVVAVIHLLPLSGVLSAERLTALYGISFNEPNLEIVMRHRAVLFGLLGVFLLHAAFQPSIQLLAFIAAFASVISFLCLAWSVGNYNAQVGRVFTADIVALSCLVVGFGAYIVTVRQA
jgi:hypothetical protein